MSNTWVSKEVQNPIGYTLVNNLPVVNSLSAASIVEATGSVSANSVIYAGGADKTGALNSSDAIMAAAAAVSGKGGVVLLQPGTYRIDKTCVIPAGVFIVAIGGGNGSMPVRFVPVSGATYTGGWMFMFNSTDGTTATSDVYRRPHTGGMVGCALDNYSTEFPNIRGIICFGSALFSDLRFYKMVCAIKRPANYYVDRWNLTRIYIDQEYAGSTEYQIELDGSGDSILLDTCTFPVGDAYQNVPMKAVRIQNSQALLSSAGAIVRGCINGKFYFRGVKALQVSGMHQEYGDYTFDKTNYSFEDSYISVNSAATTIPIRHVGDSNFTSMYYGKLKNLEFMWGFGNFKGANLFDVQTNTSFALDVDRCVRVIDVTGASPQLTGIRISENNTTTELANWKRNSHILSKNASLSAYSIANKPQTFTLVNDYSGIFYIAVENTGSGNTWDKPTGTYYYDTQYLVDVQNLVGLNQTSAIASANVTVTAGSVVNMNTSVGTNTPQCVIRIYRGTSSGSYNEYADIPCLSVKSLFDTGSMINGLPWLSRTTGPKDTLKSSTVGDWTYSPTSVIKRPNPQYVSRSTNGLYGVFGGHQVNEYNAPLTADLGLGKPANALTGDTVRIVRTSLSTGSFNVYVNDLGSAGSTVKSLAAGQWVDLFFNGTYWTVAGSGSGA